MSQPRPLMRIRAFVALELPEATLGGLEAWAGRELRDPALRVVPPENLHITLAFLGGLDEERVPEVEAALTGFEPAAVELELQPFPEGRGRHRNRPSLFAIPVRSDAVVALQAALERGLVAERLYAPEKRPFWPHLTVARVRPESRGSRKPALVERLPGPLPTALRTPVRAVRLTFYRSQTRSQGAKYTPLAQVELPV